MVIDTLSPENERTNEQAGAEPQVTQQKRETERWMAPESRGGGRRRASGLFSDRRISRDDDDDDNCRVLFQRTLDDLCRRDLSSRVYCHFSSAIFLLWHKVSMSLKEEVCFEFFSMFPTRQRVSGRALSCEAKGIISSVAPSSSSLPSPPPPSSVFFHTHKNRARKNGRAGGSGSLPIRTRTRMQTTI